jgi:hypothetical protein
MVQFSLYNLLEAVARSLDGIVDTELPAFVFFCCSALDQKRPTHERLCFSLIYGRGVGSESKPQNQAGRLSEEDGRVFPGGSKSLMSIKLFPIVPKTRWKRQSE